VPVDEAVFYFDLLGFSARAGDGAGLALDALSALAQVLGTPQLASLTGQWHHRYSLSDSVFLTTPDPLDAVRQAASLVFSLVHFTATGDDPVLVRGALAHGTVRHVRGIFLTSSEAANLVGEGVVAAVRLEQAGLKGPRILLGTPLVEKLRTRDPRFVEWLLCPTPTPGIWEILWPLPAHPDLLDREAFSIGDICRLAINLFKARGGHPAHGDHYRDFLLLAARSVERAARYVRRGEASSATPVASWLPPADIDVILETTSGLPPLFVLELRAMLSAIRGVA
jgi:hypothetical protein